MRERVAELCRRLSPIVPKQVHALWAAYVGELSVERRAEIEQTLELLATRHLGASFELDRQPFPPPPRPRNKTEAVDIEVGEVLYAGTARFPLRIPVQAFNTHALVCGRSGSGKSVLTMRLARELMRRDVVVTCFDFKRSYRQLVRDVPEGKLRVYTPGRESVAPFRWNPLMPPPGCEPMLYGKLIVDVICRALLGGEGVISLLHQGVEALYTQCGLLGGQVDRYPTIQDLLDWIERTKLTGRAGMWKASAERILRALTYGDFGLMMDTQTSADVMAILETNTVLELDGLVGASDRTLFSEGIILWLSRYLLAQGETSNLDRVFVVEEAHHLLSQSDAHTPETALEVALRMLRAYGCGFVVVDQQCSTLSKTVFANTGLTFCLNQKLRTDIQAIAGALNLTPEQRDAVSTLPVGQAIVRLPEGHPEPFLIQVPPPSGHGAAPTGERHATSPGLPQPVQSLSQSGEISDAELARMTHTGSSASTPEDEILQEFKRLRGLELFRPSHADSGVETAPDNPSAGVTAIPVSVKEERNEQARKHQSDPSTQPTVHTTDPRMDDGSSALLRDVIEYPLATTVERYERLKVSRRRGHQIRTQLVSRRELMPVRIPTRSGNVVLLTLTEAGNNRALALGLSPERIRSEGIEHRYWVQKVIDALRREGYEAHMEHQVEGNGRIDVFATRDGQSTQYEIETGRSDILNNLRKCIGYADQTVLVATNPEASRACDSAIQKLSASEQARIKLENWLDYS